MANPFLDGIGSVLSKVTNWIPNKREAILNDIDKTKQEMANVIAKKPFDAVKYESLSDRLSSLQKAEGRAS